MTSSTILIRGTDAISAAIAEAHALKGYSVAIIGADGDAARAIAGNISRHGHLAIGGTWDFGSESGSRAIVEGIAEELGGIGAAVSVGGQSRAGSLETISLADWQNELSNHLTGVFLFAKQVIPFLITSGGTFTSVLPKSGASASTEDPAASAAFHGVVGITRHLSFAYGSQGVRSNIVVHGPVSVPAVLDARLPFGRSGTPDEVAHVVAHLSSGAASYVNGGLIHVDGGLGAGYYEPAD